MNEGLNWQRGHPSAASHSIRAGTVHVGHAEYLQTEVATYEALRTTGDQVGGANIKTRNARETPHGRRANVHFAKRGWRRDLLSGKTNRSGDRNTRTHRRRSHGGGAHEPKATEAGTGTRG